MSRLKPLAWLAGLALLLAAYRCFHVQELLAASLDWARSLGPRGPAAFVAVYALASLLLIPGSALTLGAGAVYGVAWGSVWVSAASTLGAALSFLAGRHLARGWVERRIAYYPRFKAVDAAVAAEGWKIVFLTRLSPVFPFNLLNYAFGVTRVGLRDYVAASWVGMMPGTVMYVYLGAAAGELAGLGEPRGRTPAEWALFGVGLAATVAVTVHVTRLARRALDQAIAGQ